MGRRALGLVGVTIAVAALLVGCASGPGSASPSPASVVGQWGSSATQKPNLTFTENGKVAGTDGCNRISTSYTVSGDTVSFDPFMSTMMACPGVDAWLSKVKTATISGDTLLVKDATGAQIGTLAKAK